MAQPLNAGKATDNSFGSAKRAAPLDAPPRAVSNQLNKVQQPKPQALPSKGQTSAVLVSTKQKGNPVLQNIRGVPWEWADTPADFVLGQTTCALFLSLKYHRLHPEYIYGRIKGLQGKFNLRVILTMVDIPNHEESLKELSKTSLVNNVTLILTWSAAEAGRYLELFKSYENAAPTSIKAHQSSNYSDRLVDFITVPRSVNKTDAMSLVSTFGSLRTAVNAAPEEIALVTGWGGKKVQRWCGSVREPFRVRKATRRSLNKDDSRATRSRDVSRAEPVEEDIDMQDDDVALSAADRVNTPVKVAGEAGRQFADLQGDGDDEDDMDILAVTGQLPAPEEPHQPTLQEPEDPELTGGIATALSKLRKE